MITSMLSINLFKKKPNIQINSPYYLHPNSYNNQNINSGFVNNPFKNQVMKETFPVQNSFPIKTNVSNQIFTNSFNMPNYNVANNNIPHDNQNALITSSVNKGVLPVATSVFNNQQNNEALYSSSKLPINMGYPENSLNNFNTNHPNLQNKASNNTQTDNLPLIIPENPNVGIYNIPIYPYSTETKFVNYSELHSIQPVETKSNFTANVYNFSAVREPNHLRSSVKGSDALINGENNTVEDNKLVNNLVTVHNTYLITDDNSSDINFTNGLKESHQIKQYHYVNNLTFPFTNNSYPLNTFIILNSTNQTLPNFIGNFLNPKNFHYKNHTHYVEILDTKFLDSNAINQINQTLNNLINSSHSLFESRNVLSHYSISVNNISSLSNETHNQTVILLRNKTENNQNNHLLKKLVKENNAFNSSNNMNVSLIKIGPFNKIKNLTNTIQLKHHNKTLNSNRTEYIQNNLTVKSSSHDQSNTSKLNLNQKHHLNNSKIDNLNQSISNTSLNNSKSAQHKLKKKTHHSNVSSHNLTSEKLHEDNFSNRTNQSLSNLFKAGKNLSLNLKEMTKNHHNDSINNDISNKTTNNILIFKQNHSVNNNSDVKNSEHNINNYDNSSDHKKKKKKHHLNQNASFITNYNVINVTNNKNHAIDNNTNLTVHKKEKKKHHNKNKLNDGRNETYVNATFNHNNTINSVPSEHKKKKHHNKNKVANQTNETIINGINHLNNKTNVNESIDHQKKKYHKKKNSTKDHSSNAKEKEYDIEQIENNNQTVLNISNDMNYSNKFSKENQIKTIKKSLRLNSKKLLSQDHEQKNSVTDDENDEKENIQLKPKKNIKKKGLSFRKSKKLEITDENNDQVLDLQDSILNEKEELNKDKPKEEKIEKQKKIVDKDLSDQKEVPNSNENEKKEKEEENVEEKEETFLKDH